ncbi:MAG: outer membrane beta-barrel domain-containing protein [Bdellovibrionaceae bacterium]|nr:outer membrane beta-barrel domain-containing protein [Pseudobdellovibrionaceae bacterium]
MNLKTFAQSEPPSVSGDDANIELEALYDEFDKEEDKKAEDEQVKKQKERETVQKSEMGTLAELKVLSPFDDIAVIQRRYMPKTNRFEFSAALGNSLNNAFFNNWGAIGRVAYYLTEKHGLEFQFFWLNSNERAITESLRNDQSVQTRSLVVPENYKGISYKYVPVYGKIALFNKRIIPFDLYFSVGGGLTNTGLEEEESTINLGTGQQFYITKAMALRWDFALNVYTADIYEDNNGTLKKSTKAQTDLFIALGVSYYWPGATYR